MFKLHICKIRKEFQKKNDKYIHIIQFPADEEGSWYLKLKKKKIEKISAFYSFAHF